MTSAPFPLNAAPLVWDHESGQLVEQDLTEPVAAPVAETDKATAWHRTAASKVRDGLESFIGQGIVYVGAALATGVSYTGMVAIGINEFGMTRPEAYATMGVIELMLTAFALLARRQAKHGMSTRLLMTSVVVLSLIAGVLATAEQWMSGGGWLSLFRMVPPAVAALAWHFLLTLDQAEATGRTLGQIRADMAVNRFVERSVDLGLLTAPGMTAPGWRIAIARGRLIRARRAMGKRVPVAQIEPMVAARRAAVEAANVAGQQVGIAAREWSELVRKSDRRGDQQGDRKVTAEVTTPSDQATTEVTGNVTGKVTTPMTTPVTTEVTARPARKVTTKVTGKATTGATTKVTDDHRAAARQMHEDGTLTIARLRDLGLSRRDATDLAQQTKQAAK